MGDNEFPKFPQIVFLIPLLALPVSAAIWFAAQNWNTVSAQRSAAVVAEMDPSQYQAMLRVYFDGRPFTSSAPPSFWFRNEAIGREVEASVKLRDGNYYVSGLQPGKYGVQLTYNTNSANIVNSPGDYYSWTPFEVVEKKPAIVNIDLSRIIHLLRPEDNNLELGGWVEEGGERTPTVEPKAEFAWESLGPDTEYTYSVEVIQYPYTALSTAFRGTTKDTKLVMQLPSSKANQFYLMRLDAARNAKQIGILMTWGPNFLAWDYRFRVK